MKFKIFMIIFLVIAIVMIPIYLRYKNIETQDSMPKKEEKVTVLDSASIFKNTEQLYAFLSDFNLHFSVKPSLLTVNKTVWETDYKSLSAYAEKVYMNLNCTQNEIVFFISMNNKESEIDVLYGPDVLKTISKKDISKIKKEYLKTVAEKEPSEAFYDAVNVLNS